MKIITNTVELNKEFRRLLSSYSRYSWLSAWAGKPFDLTEILLKNSSKIQKIVIGLHFYQTHPDFIEKFIDKNNIRYIKQTEGTFHSKLYLFENTPTDWELLIGSNNFTGAAFSTNTESAFLINPSYHNSLEVLNNAKIQIDKFWQQSKMFTTTELKEYRTVYLNQQRKINSLSSTYGIYSNNSNPIYNVPVLTMDWNDYAEKVINDRYGSAHERLRIIENAHKFFLDYHHFKDMPSVVRKAIAGTYNGLNDGDDWFYFGSMQGAGRFMKRINENDEKISFALDQIPLKGQITKNHYKDYLKYFLNINDLNPIATSTRFLALKRPDVFVCLDNKNVKNLSKAFGLNSNDVRVENYWDLIIERIMDSEWWQNPKPRNTIERRVEVGRSAMLDSIYYDKN